MLTWSNGNALAPAPELEGSNLVKEGECVIMFNYQK